MKTAMTNMYLRSVVKPRLALMPLDVGQIRALGESFLGPGAPQPEDVRQIPLAAQPTRGLCAAEWLVSEAALPVIEQHPTVLYTHGGAYCFGGLASHRPACSYLARHLPGRVLSLDYRLAPEHPYPAAVDDALIWYRTLLDLGTPAEHIVLAGDSAGGGLALACALAARQAGLPLPAGVVVFSPWTDLTCSGKSLRAQAHSDAMLPATLLPEAAAIYLNGQDPSEPLASPLLADLSGLPPLLIYASRGEILLDDARRLHERAQAQGVDSQLHLRLYLPHAWPAMLPLKEARETLREAARFMGQQTGLGCP